MADQRSNTTLQPPVKPSQTPPSPETKLPRGRIKDGSRLVWFIMLSAALNGAGAMSGYWWKFPEPVTPPENAIELTDIDTNDAPPLLQPDEPETPPEPEPTPPPPEPEPTPPPLDKPPEFEIPEPTPTPTPPPKPVETAKPIPTPPRTEERKPAPPHPAKPATGTHGPNPPNASPNGVAGGTGHPGARSGRLLRSPSPPYPPQALSMHITGDVRVTIQVQAGNVVSAEPSSGPPILASAAARWVRSNWKFAPDQTGTFTLPVRFVIAQ
jgi:outer membrane biosynthesis protein TonB